MEAVIGLLKLAGGMIFIFAASYAFACVSGYGKYYDKMFYGDASDKCITIKKKNKDNKVNDEDMIHHASIKKQIQNGNKTINGSNY